MYINGIGEIMYINGMKLVANENATNLEPKKVIFNDPATIVYWKDGEKTVVRAADEPYDPEKGFAMCIVKKAFGNEGSYYEIFRHWLPKDYQNKG